MESEWDRAVIKQALGMFEMIPTGTTYADRRDDFAKCRRWVKAVGEVALLPDDDTERVAVVAAVVAEWTERIDLRSR